MEETKEKVKKATKTLAKQKRFAQEYVIDRNGARAAEAAGYGKKTAKEAASRLLTFVNVQEEISRLDKELDEKALVTAERVRAEYAKLAFYDPRVLFNESGILKPINELTEDEAKLIVKMDEEEIFEGSGKNHKKVGIIRKISFLNRVNLLRDCAKITGLMIQKVEVHGGRNLGQEMLEAEKRVREAQEWEKAKQGNSS
jgi:phage terminase small subunit